LQTSRYTSSSVFRSGRSGKKLRNTPTCLGVKSSRALTSSKSSCARRTLFLSLTIYHPFPYRAPNPHQTKTHHLACLGCVYMPRQPNNHSASINPCASETAFTANRRSQLLHLHRLRLAHARHKLRDTIPRANLYKIRAVINQRDLNLAAIIRINHTHPVS